MYRKDEEQLNEVGLMLLELVFLTGGSFLGVL